MSFIIIGFNAGLLYWSALIVQVFLIKDCSIAPGSLDIFSSVFSEFL